MRTDLSTLENREFDVAVIGGGINGASAAQHAAAEGYSVLIVDKTDFGSGATSRSSRLLHCGLRYFEAPNPLLYFLRNPGRFVTATRMAHQAMQARRELVTTAQSRTRPITFMFPVFADGPYTEWQVDLAFRLLGSLAPKDVPLDYHRQSPGEARTNPLIAALSKPDQLLSVATFTEYQLNWPERICIDAVLDAERMGAMVRNYTRANLKSRDNGRWNIELVDTLNGETADASAKSVCIMAGIWIDKVIKTAKPDAPRKTFGTKGAHIVVQLPSECRDFGITTTNALGEPYYCIPWHGHHYIGPTETPFDGNCDEVSASEEDVSFLLEQTNAILPGLKITRDNVLSTWAGVRPLTYDPALPKGKRSRDLHDLSSAGLDGVFAMTAGPVMTHRSAGREVVSRLKSFARPSGSPQEPCFEPRVFENNTNTKPLLNDRPEIHLGHLRTCVRDEHALTLADVLYRRTGLGWNRALSSSEVSRAADAICRELQCPKSEREKMIAQFKTEVRSLFGHPHSARKAKRQSVKV